MKLMKISRGRLKRQKHPGRVQGRSCDRNFSPLIYGIRPVAVAFVLKLPERPATRYMLQIFTTGDMVTTGLLISLPVIRFRSRFRESHFQSLPTFLSHLLATLLIRVFDLGRARSFYSIVKAGLEVRNGGLSGRVSRTSALTSSDHVSAATGFGFHPRNAIK
ncbi:MAG: hypothetical protein AXW12_19905 [Thalassospira sp. Nap_22]|nr:MAG: hypothetical protein AXW12_19905 [Thalassospira sp. Nap_22]